MKNSRVIIFFIVYNLITHLPFLNLPPVGSHVWRQCNTLAMSRNFAEEGMHILESRIDRRNETNGITGSHFPLYEWGLGAIYRLTGEHYWVHRIYSLIIFSFACVAFYWIVVLLGHTGKTAIFAGALLSSIPQLYYDSINAMPDNLALSLSLWSSYYILKNTEKPNNSNWFKALILFSLGGMIKFQYLILPLSFLIHQSARVKSYHRTGIFIVLGLVPVLMWYSYAKRLTDLNNLREYGLWIKPIELSRMIQTIGQNVLSDIPELIIGWPLAFSILLIGIRYRKSLHQIRHMYLFGSILILFMGFYGLAIERMGQHPYYFISVIPLFPLLIVEMVSIGRIKTYLLISICFANQVWAFLRIIPSRWQANHYQISETFANPAYLRELKSMIPKSERYIVGPDLSGCIYFYFTSTKGYSFANVMELEEIKHVESGENALDIMAKNGAKILIGNRENTLETFMNTQDKWVLDTSYREFSIWRHP